MKAHNFNEKICQYIQTNPKLKGDDLGTLLLIDTLYLELPSNNSIKEFKRKYRHFDPDTIDNFTEGITFLNIVDKKYSSDDVEKKFNDYLNIKFNSVGSHKQYKDNKKIFEKYSKIAAALTEELLIKAKFPKKVIKILREKKELQNCHDICDLHNLYKNTRERRIKFAILRRIGLIILMARIKRSFSFEDLDFATSQIETVFKDNLFAESLEVDDYFFWADHTYKSHYSNDKKLAKIEYQKACAMRKKLASKVYDMQVFKTTPFLTKQNNKILHFEIRNKFKIGGKITLTSVVEKMIRKNLEFPNQVHDVIGLKIITAKINDIAKVIDELEIFLGGSSTRKREKNVVDKTGKRKLSEQSTGEYFVWKAIYDVALPHPSIKKVIETIKFVDKNTTAHKMLNDRIKFFKNNPRDFVVEVQIQDLKSYILSETKGSIPQHAMLKMAQIKENSFYKFFPIEIYKTDLWKLKEKILCSN